LQILRVENLYKNFAGLCVLNGLSFDVGEQEKLAIIGPNGAGKTTLFNVIGGQIPATAGRIEFLGHDIAQLTPHHRLHRGLSRSFQINSLFFNLALLDNILLALQGGSYPHYSMIRPLNARTELFSKAQDLLETMGLWEKRQYPVAALSYGDQRSLEVSLGLASKPKLLMLDEPTAGLSPAEAASFESTIKPFLEDTSLIFTAHDMDLVFSLADRIIVLYFGKIIAQGLPQEIKENQQVREIYLGSNRRIRDA